MSAFKFTALLALALVGGLIGGLLSTRLLRPDTASASESIHNATTIAARSFLLIDEHGKVRGSFTILPDGSPGFLLHDKQGASKLKLSLLSDDSPSLSMYSAGNKNGVVIAAMSDGGGYLKMNDKDGMERLEMGVGVRASRQNEKGTTPSLILFHQDGSVGGGLKLGEEGESFVGIAGKGERRASVTLEVKRTTPSLTLSDSNGRARSTMAVGSDGGSPILWFFDKDNNQDITLSGSNDKSAPVLVLTKVGPGLHGGGLILFDKEKVLTKLP